MQIFRLRALQVFFCLAFFLALPGIDPVVNASEKEETVRLTRYLSLGVKVKRLDNSHTSYEFGDLFPPYVAPLSRLEFPLDSWWTGGELRASFPRFSMGIEVLTNARGDAGGRMYDSDWDNNDPDLMTTFSASRCRMEQGYMASADVDMEVSDWLNLPQWFSLRPVVGMRYQYFRLVAHNGIQYDLTGVTPYDLLPSNSIRFKQTYWQYFIGVRSGIDAGRYIGIQDLKLTTQFDVAYVEAANEDKHLLRLGNRFTYEDTFGHAWHASIGLKKGLSKNLFLGVDFDYLCISTAGSHRFLNRPLGFDESWGNGVKVWSEQKSISLSLEYRFD
jgi:hypothetical protein